MIGNAAVEPEPAEPTVGEVQVDLLAEPSFGADTEAVADDQHPNHQFRIDRRSPDCAVEGGELPPNLRQLHERADRPQEMIRGNMTLERELVDQRALVDLP